MPLCSTAPAGAFILQLGNDAARFLGSAKRHKHLIEHNLIQYVESCLLKALSENPCKTTISLNQFSESLSAQRAKGGPQLNSSGPPG